MHARETKVPWLMDVKDRDRDRDGSCRKKKDKTGWEHFSGDNGAGVKH